MITRDEQAYPLPNYKFVCVECYDKLTAGIIEERKITSENDKAWVSKYNDDRKTWDTVYDYRDTDKWSEHKWIIVAKHPDGIHHIVEYEWLPWEVFKEDLSEEWFTKTPTDEYQRINNAFIDAGLEHRLKNSTTKDSDIDTLKKCLIHHMPSNG